MTDFDALEREQTERDQRLAAPTALRDAALWYASNGWPVFPLWERGKTPLTRHGFKSASTDASQVARWWAKVPASNIGTPTGIKFDAVDIDGPEGFFSLARVQHVDCDSRDEGKTCGCKVNEFLGRPILAKAYTGGGGRHLLVAPSGDGNRAALLPGIDYRGAGGYIVLPPSLHASGRRYDWLEAPDNRLLG